MGAKIYHHCDQPLPGSPPGYEGSMPGSYAHIRDMDAFESSAWEHPYPPILLVMIDQVPHHIFLAHVRYLKSTNKVARVIVDEPQALVASQRYRPVMTQLTVMAEMGIQIGLLSATLPPGIVPPLMRMLGIRHLHVVRGCTARQNLAYRRHLFHKSSQLRQAVVALAKDLIGQMTTEERGFIICRTKADSSYFADALGAKCYNSDLSPKEQVVTLQRFRSMPKPSRTIACTTGLTQGVHIPHARWSIHAGLPYDMVDAIQSLGRIGCDGKLSHCHLMALRSQCVEVEDGVLEGDVLGVAAIRRTVSGHQLCVQEQLTGFNDGRALSCGALNSALCDRCDALGMLRNAAAGPFLVSWLEIPFLISCGSDNPLQAGAPTSFSQIQATDTPSVSGSNTSASTSDMRDHGPSLPTGSMAFSHSESRGLKRRHNSSSDPASPLAPSSLPPSSSRVALCGSSSSSVVAGPGILRDQALAQSRGKKFRQEQDRLKNTLNEVKLYCSLHWARWGTRQDHSAARCTEMGVVDFFVWKKTVCLPAGNELCFICWAAIENFEHKVCGQECEVGDILPQVAYAAWVEPTFRLQLEGIGLSRDATDETYQAWLVRKKDGEFNFMAVFWMIYGIRTHCTVEAWP